MLTIVIAHIPHAGVGRSDRSGGCGAVDVVDVDDFLKGLLERRRRIEGRQLHVRVMMDTPKGMGVRLAATTAAGRVTGNYITVEGANGGADDPIGLDSRLMQRLEDSGLESAKCVAALQHPTRPACRTVAPFSRLAPLRLRAAAGATNGPGTSLRSLASRAALFGGGAELVAVLPRELIIELLKLQQHGRRVDRSYARPKWLEPGKRRIFAGPESTRASARGACRRRSHRS